MNLWHGWLGLIAKCVRSGETDRDTWISIRELHSFGDLQRPHGPRERASLSPERFGGTTLRNLLESQRKNHKEMAGAAGLERANFFTFS